MATDAVGDVFQYVEYLPTGQPWVAGQSKIKDTPYLYAGGWTDPTYSLVNFGSRWFSPREEAFISPEPLLTEDPDSAVGDPGLLAAYTYASANPLIWVDPDGRASEPYTIASTGTVFDLGTGFAKHQKGDITISDASRENRDGPAKLGTLLLSYNADGQARAASWIEIDDAITRYTTPLAFEQSGGRKKVRIFGKTVSDKPIANQAADAGGGRTGRHESAASAAGHSESEPNQHRNSSGGRRPSRRTGSTRSATASTARTISESRPRHRERSTTNGTAPRGERCCRRRVTRVARRPGCHHLGSVFINGPHRSSRPPIEERRLRDNLPSPDPIRRTPSPVDGPAPDPAFRSVEGSP